MAPFMHDIDHILQDHERISYAFPASLSFTNLYISLYNRGGHRLSSDTKNVAMATFIVAQETKNGVGVKLVPRFSFR